MPGTPEEPRGLRRKRPPSRCEPREGVVLNSSVEFSLSHLATDQQSRRVPAVVRRLVLLGVVQVALRSGPPGKDFQILGTLGAGAKRQPR